MLLIIYTTSPFAILLKLRINACYSSFLPKLLFCYNNFVKINKTYSFCIFLPVTIKDNSLFIPIFSYY